MWVLSLSLSLDNKGDQPIQLSGIDVILSAPQTSRGYNNISRLCARASKSSFFFLVSVHSIVFVLRLAIQGDSLLCGNYTLFFFLLLIFDRLARTLADSSQFVSRLIKNSKLPTQKDIAIISFLSSYYIYAHYFQAKQLIRGTRKNKTRNNWLTFLFCFDVIYWPQLRSCQRSFEIRARGLRSIVITIVCLCLHVWM